MVEDYDDKLKAFEFKWRKTEKVRFPQTFTINYPDATTQVVSPDNVEDFILV